MKETVDIRVRVFRGDGLDRTFSLAEGDVVELSDNHGTFARIDVVRMPEVKRRLFRKAIKDMGTEETPSNLTPGDA